MNNFEFNKVFIMDDYSFYENPFIKEFVKNLNKNLNPLNPLEAHKDINKSCKYTINAIAKRKGWSYNKTKNFLLTLNSIYPKSLKDMLYRVISLETKQKKQYIYKQCIYGIALTLSNEDIVVSIEDPKKQYFLEKSKEHSTFYTKEDAEWAIKVVEKILEVFNGKQKN